MKRIAWGLVAGLLAGGAWNGWDTGAGARPELLPGALPSNVLLEQTAVSPAPVHAARPAAPDPRRETTAYLERQQFQERAREFFQRAGQLDPGTRAREAQYLESVTARYEHAGELSAGESLLLRVGLIRATVADETAQAEQIAALTERYRIDAEQRMAAWSSRPDPAFDAYKERERAVVSEVMALTVIPGGLERDEYLRQRLQRERELAFADGGH